MKKTIPFGVKFNVQNGRNKTKHNKKKKLKISTSRNMPTLNFRLYFQLFVCNIKFFPSISFLSYEIYTNGFTPIFVKHFPIPLRRWNFCLARNWNAFRLQIDINFTYQTKNLSTTQCVICLFDKRSTLRIVDLNRIQLFIRTLGSHYIVFYYFLELYWIYRSVCTKHHLNTNYFTIICNLS